VLTLGFFGRLKDGMSKTRKNITERIDQMLVSFGKIDDDLFDELEEILITSDVGIETTMRIIADIKAKVREKKLVKPDDVKMLLKDELTELLGPEIPEDDLFPEGDGGSGSPAVIVVVGVNGVGKTTSIGKMASYFKRRGKKIVLAAGDTFRAAAIDQLTIWSERVGVDIIKHSEGSDPAAVVYDAVQAAKARKADYLICDTAGRLHTKKNLMEELKKVIRVIERELPGTETEIMLVLDATTGQNAISQAKTFSEAVKVTGLILTKLDGTAKGGIVAAIKSELDIPVKLVGVGEKIDDLQPFNSREFVEALF
jgi:fused signal recognition particle receptor